MKKSAHNLFLQIAISLVCIFSLLFPLNVSVSAQEQVLGDVTTFSESQKTLLVAKPAVAQVTNVVTGELIIQAALANTLGAPEIAGMYYEFVVGMGGSGFFVTPDGYFITNGHVAKPEDDLIALYAISQLAETIWSDAIIFAWEATYGYTPSEAEVSETFDYILETSYGGSWDAMVWDLYATDYRGGNLKMDNVKQNNFIQTGFAAGTQNVVMDLGKPATLVDTSYDGAFDSKDLALLKVEGSNFPTLELGSFQHVQIGTEVYAIGYPGVVEEMTGIFTDVEAELEPSITSGIISAKKKLVDGTEAFQTDAGITHGNSGGPAIGTDGKVIGVTTWGFGDEAGGESFNFLISVEQVNTLLTRNGVTPSTSTTSTKWEEALTQYSNKCYTKAKEEFDAAKALYPDNVDVDDFISKCQTAIENGEDECLTKYSTWMIIGVVVCCLGGGGAVVAIIFVVFVARRKKPKEENTESEKKKK